MGADAALIPQAAAIPVRAGRICLVTSRNGKRWVFPKGCMERGKTRRQIALQEAWEEAGVRGIIHPEPVGTYCYEKAGHTCSVTVFLMDVIETLPAWPESVWRQRRWWRPEKALMRIKDRELRKLLRRILALGRVSGRADGQGR